MIGSSAVSTGPGERRRRSPPAVPGGPGPEARRRRARLLVAAGWVVALLGVAVYCVASQATELEADLAAVVLHGAVPVARLGLLAIASGALLAVVGAVQEISALDATET